jgi:hypothetical protein
MPQITDSKYLVTAGWDNVPHLDEQTKAELLASTPVHLRDARSKGIPALGSGAIFPVDEASITCDPIKIPEHWPQIIGIDFGYDHPTGAANIAWDRDLDVIYITADYKESEKTPPVHSLSLKAWGVWKPVAWPHDGLQHDKGSGVALVKQYRDQGMKMLKDKATHAPDPKQKQKEGEGGNGVEAGLMEMLERMQSERLKVFKTCTKWLAEFRLYHRKDGKVVKEFDDAISASRYAIMMKRHAITKPVKQDDFDANTWQPLDPTMGY